MVIGSYKIMEILFLNQNTTFLCEKGSNILKNIQAHNSLELRLEPYNDNEVQSKFYHICSHFNIQGIIIFHTHMSMRKGRIYLCNLFRWKRVSYH